MADVIVKKGLEEVEFFGEADMTVNRDTGEKKIGSEYPAYYFEQQCREINDGITRLGFDLENSQIPDKGKPAAVAELKKLKAMKDKIDNSRPQIEGHEDELRKVRDTLGKKIAETKYKRSDMLKGLADGHEEYRRQSEPIIELRGDEMLLAKKMNCRIVNGKVSRNDADRVWKIISRSLGENSDAEVLRRD
jgi:hypothetical protein